MTNRDCRDDGDSDGATDFASSLDHATREPGDRLLHADECGDLEGHAAEPYSDADEQESREEIGPVRGVDRRLAQ